MCYEYSLHLVGAMLCLALGGCKVAPCTWWGQGYSLHLVGARLQMNLHFGSSFFLCDTTPCDPMGTHTKYWGSLVVNFTRRGSQWD